MINVIRVYLQLMIKVLYVIIYLKCVCFVNNATVLG